MPLMWECVSWPDKADLIFAVTVTGGKTMIEFEDPRIAPSPYDPVMLFNEKEWASIKAV